MSHPAPAVMNTMAASAKHDNPTTTARTSLTLRHPAMVPARTATTPGMRRLESVDEVMSTNKAVPLTNATGSATSPSNTEAVLTCERVVLRRVGWLLTTQIVA